MGWLLVGVWVTSMSPPVLAAELPDPPDFASRVGAPDPDLRIGCLDSGLEVRVAEDSRLPVVRITTVIDGGIRPRRTRGVASRTSPSTSGSKPHMVRAA